MSTVKLSAEINSVDVPLFEKLLKQFKAKSIKIEEKDSSKMSKEELFTKIDNGLKEYKCGKTKEFKTFKDFETYISK